MKRGLLCTFVLVCVSLAAVGQGLYPVYYDCTFPWGGIESATRLFVSNPGDTGIQYTVTLHNPNGIRLGSATYFVNAHACSQTWLPDLLSGDRSYAWGLCKVETSLGYPTDLEVVAERYIGGMLVGYDEVPRDAVSAKHAFFYNASQSLGGPDNDSHICVMNPTETANGYVIELHDAYGTIIAVEQGVVNPGTCKVHRLSDLASGRRDFAMGLCIVRAETYAYEKIAVNVFRMRDGRLLNSQTVP